MSSPFVSNIQQWLVLEKQIKSLNEKTKQLRDQRHTLSSQICEHIQSNQLQKTKIEIANSGELKMVERRDYSSLTFGYIEKQLDDLVISGNITKQQMDIIIHNLKNNREQKIHNEIVLFTKNT